MTSWAAIYTGSCSKSVTYTLDTSTGMLEISGTGEMRDFTTSETSLAPWNEYCSSIKTIKIQNSVKNIGSFAFCDCINLTSITIPESVTKIGHMAFQNCSKLTAITIPDGVRSIAQNTFNGCANLTSVTIPEGVTSIGSSAFKDCSRLTSINIPEEVNSIGNFAFYGCTSLTSLTIPVHVTKIESCTFEGCTSLASIILPDGVTSIGTHAFEDCTSLTSVTIPEGVTNISEYTFRNCAKLTSINIPENVKTIDKYAFYKCSSLTSITIPEGVTSIAERTFHGCSNLASITIPEGITDIGIDAFSGCSSLTAITIPEGVTSIGIYAFAGCSNLTSVKIPRSVTNIYLHAFLDCNKIESLTWGSSSCSPSTITQYCKDSLKEVYLTDGLNNISQKAFYGCSALTSVSIPNSVTYIEESAFHGCSSLTSVTIPASVTSIGDAAFRDCKKLETVTCLAVDVPQTGSSIFTNVDTEYATLLVPESSVDLYKSTSPWSNFGTIKSIVMQDNILQELAKLYNEYKNYTFKAETGISQYGKDEVEAFNEAMFEASNILANESEYSNDAIKAAIEQLKITYEAVLASKVEAYELIDGTAVSIAEEKTFSILTYTRAFNNTNWQPLYVPFSMQYSDWASQGLEVARLNGFYEYDDDKDGRIDRSALEVLLVTEGEGALMPNHPYMIRANATGTKSIVVNNATLCAAEENAGDCSTFETKYTFTGTYGTLTQSELEAMGAYIMGGGKLTPSAGALRPMRWYMTRESRGGQLLPVLKEIKVFVQGEEDALDFVNAESEDGATYNLMGQKVNREAKGITIRNGRKYVR